MTIDATMPSPYLLAALFFAVAFIYSTIGLAGGSSYLALMALFIARVRLPLSSQISASTSTTA